MVTHGAGRKQEAERKQFGHEGQISYRSHPEIVAKFRVAVAKLALATRFDGSLLKPGHLANALVHWVGEMSDEELAETCLPLLRSLERYVQGGAVVLDDKPRHARAKVVDEQEEAKKRRRA